MLLSRNWLKKYVNLADSAATEELASKLNLSTVEVESYEEKGKNLAHIVVGKILKIDPHPQADKLKVCLVEVEKKKLIIVCGGSNLAEGMLVVVAEVGAKVKWHGEGEEVELKTTEIRGIKSEGMICAADEIGLVELFPKKEAREIVDLSTLRVQVGAPLAQALELEDSILEIDNKSLSHRPDLWGHYGMAREIAALYNRKVVPYKIPAVKPGKEIEFQIKVADSKLCSRYMGVVLSGIKVVDSPTWLKKSLSAVGVRPINVIVDVTNYVMLDIGQPLHAFDAKKVDGEHQNSKQLFVRPAKEKEEAVTLDGKKHLLNAANLVIADEQNILALAGIMGGLDSSVTEGTTQIILEAACFNAPTIRKSAVVLNLRTDSSARFEKSLDPNLCKEALHKAVELILQLVPGSYVSSPIVDYYPKILRPVNLSIPLAFFSKKLGIDIPLKNIVAILDRLGFETESKKDILNIKVPTWRATKDVLSAEDVVEEVVRLYGYERVTGSLPSFPITPAERDKVRMLKYDLLDLLVKQFKYTEVYNYSFVSGGTISRLGDDLGTYLELDNPLSKEKPFLRRNLVISLLENIEKNYTTGSALRLLEIGKNYLKEEAGARVILQGGELLPRQDTICAFSYLEKDNNTPFWEVRRVVERIFSSKNNWLLRALSEPAPWHHPTRAAEIVYQDKVVGIIYELHPFVLERWNIEDRVAVVELNLNLLAELDTEEVTHFIPLSLYPEVTRDLAFWVSKDMAHAEIEKTLYQTDPLIKKVELFDLYTEDTKSALKSMAYRLTYANLDRTLTTEEIDLLQQKVTKVLVKNFKAEMRI